MKKIILSLFFLGTILNSNAQVPSYVPKDSLKGWWPFSGNANDQSGNGNNGTVSGATLTSDRFGNNNSAYNFNAANSNILIPSSKSQNFTTKFTVSLWAKYDNTTDQSLFFRQGNSGNYDRIWLRVIASTMPNTFRVYNENSYFATFTNAMIKYNEWYNITAVFKDSSITVYNNGILISQTKINNGLKCSQTPMILGNAAGQGNYNGLIDDVLVWNRDLTQQEVLNLYNRYSPICKLVNSATFTVPNVNRITQNSYVNNASNTSASIDTGKWVYVAYSKNSSNVSKLYLNGVLQSTGTYSNLSYSWSRIDIGAVFFTSYGAWFKGLIDELRVSNVERTASEIQSNYSSNAQFSKDNNTIGLYHFDENNGTTANGVIGAAGSIVNAQWVTGKYGSCLSYNGTNARTQINLALPSTNNTIEFWLYLPNVNNFSVPISSYGLNTNGYTLNKTTANVSYKWSTGATGNSITVNPQNYKFIWVTDGNCYDTIWFDSESKNIYDTVRLSTTDTLYIKVNTSTMNNPVYNNIKVFPNPSSTQVVIDNGNYNSMSSYSVKIVNSIGQQVFQSVINQQQFIIDLKSLGSPGVYTLSIIDSNGNPVGVKKIVLQ